MIKNIEEAFAANEKYGHMKIDIIDSLILDKVLPLLDSMGLVVIQKELLLSLQNNSSSALSPLPLPALSGGEQPLCKFGQGDSETELRMKAKEPIPVVIKRSLLRCYNSMLARAIHWKAVK